MTATTLRPARSHPAPGLLLALGATVAMGSAAAALKAMGAAGLSAVNVSQARELVGAAALMAIALVLRRGRMGVPRRDWWLVGAYGVVGLAVNRVVFNLALLWLPVGVALLLEYLAPVLVALWVRFVARRPVSGIVWVAIAGTLLGLGLVGQVWSGFALPVAGFVLGMLAAVTMASRFLLTEHGLRRHDPLVLAAWGTTASAGALTLAGLVDPFPFGALAVDVDLNGVGVPMPLMVLWVALIGTTAAVLLAVTAQRMLAPTSMSLIQTLEVVVGAALAALILGESLTAAQTVGGAVMLAGVVLAQVGISRRPAERLTPVVRPGGGGRQGRPTGRGHGR